MKSVRVAMFCLMSLVLMVLPDTANAQNYLRTPSVDSILNPAEIIGRTNYHRGGTEWIVFSDRDNNPVYSSSSGGAISARMPFMKMFKVKDETADYLLVSDAKSNSEIGWMKKENLSMLSRCVRKPNRVAKKAMIINTLKNIDQGDNTRDFYKDPNLTRPNTEGDNINVYTICYVYKETDSTVLLGRREDCSTDVEAYFQDQIFGWIHRKYLTAWDSRGCLQPNYNEVPANYRREKKSPAVLFDDINWATNYKDKVSFATLENQARSLEDNPIVWQDDDYKTRPWNPSKFRLPFLSSTSTSGVIKVGVLGDIKDESGRAMMELIEKMRDEYTSSSINNLNVVFVIDGTYSMKSYFPAVVEAIEQSANRINANPKYSDPDNPNRIIVNWGSVVYRDAAEDDNALETFNLTQNYRDLAKWLGSAFSDAKNANDLDVCEAVYYGLYNALEDVLAEKEEENNLIILIGDAGDHQRGDDDWTHIYAHEIIESMVNLNTHFIAYQTHYKDPAKTGVKGDSSYTDFVEQMKHISEQSAKMIYTQSRPNVNESEIFLKNNSLSQLFELNKNILANKVLYNTGSDMSESILTKNINASIDKSAESTSIFMSMIYDVLYGGKSIDEISVKYGFDPNDLDMAEFRGLSYIIEQIAEIEGLSPDSDEFQEKLSFMLSKKVQLYFEGYAPIKSKDSKYSLWAFDVLASSSAKKQLVRDLRRVEKAFQSGGSDNRKQRKLVTSTLTDLARIYSGDKGDDLQEMKIGTLFESIIDCPGLQFSRKYSDVLNMRIKDVEVENRCSVTELKVIYRAVKAARTSLQGVSFEGYGTRAFNTFTAYWIPIDKFPFMK